MKYIWLWSVLFFCNANAQGAGIYHPEVHKLQNGLEVIVLKNQRAASVIHMLCVKVGTNQSPWSKSGLAHYLEHLMFKGQPDSAAGSVMRIVNRLGGELNAFTSQDYTIYYEIVPSEHLETVMDLDAKRFSALEIKDEWAKPEIDVILEERSMRVENTIAGLFNEVLTAKDMDHHPSRLPVIGWAHEIKRYTSEDAQEFYQKWYTPQNAFIVIAGDINFSKAKELAEKYYGPLPSRASPPRLTLQEPPLRKFNQTIEMTSDIIDAPLSIRRYRAPSFDQKNSKPYYALLVLENLLGRSVTGRLTRSLVEKQQLASQISIIYTGLTSGPGTFQIMMVPAPHISLVKLEEALDNEMKILSKEGMSESEIEKAKSNLLSELVYTQDDIIQGAQTFATLHVLGISNDEIEAWPDRIKAVTMQEVQKVSHQVFTQSFPLIGRLLPKKEKKSEATH